MTTERWRKIEHIFQAAADLSPAERNAFLADACTGDPVLRREVDQLLAADENGAGGIDTAVGVAVQRQAEHLARDGSESAVVGASA